MRIIIKRFNSIRFIIVRCTLVMRQFKYINIIKCCDLNVEASRGAGAQIVTVKSTGCGFEPYSRKLNIYLHLYFHYFALVSRQTAALSSATHHAMPPELSGKWGTEYIHTRCTLPTLL